MRLATENFIGAAFLAFGLAATALSFTVGSQMWGGESARLFPLFVSIVIAALGGLMLLKGSQTYHLGDEAKNVLRLAIIGLGYVWAISKLGYLIATFTAAPLIFWVFGIRSPLALMLSAFICPAIFHMIFFVGLGVFPPFGDWFDLLDVLQGY